jgi:hypothetical protein
MTALAATGPRDVRDARRKTNYEALARSHVTYRERRDRIFWSLATVEGECWVWQGRLQTQNKFGTEPYGVLFRYGRNLYAHRYAYELVKGLIPKGMEIRHSCDRPRCINPAHLLVGTHAENMADMSKRGRARTRPLRGENAPWAILTEAGIREIRIALESGETHRSLGIAYGVHRSTITRLARGLTWREVV